MIKKFIIGNILKSIRNKHPEYTEIDLEKIEYGLTSLYLQIPKMIIIITVAYLIGMLSETITFIFIHVFIKMNTFGMHANKSWVCLLVSLIIFIIMPWLALNGKISIINKLIIGFIGIGLLVKNSPADTQKKPIINAKIRAKHNRLATITAVVFVIFSITISNTFVANCFILSLSIQSLMTSPVIYSFFKLPYNNHLNYSN